MTDRQNSLTAVMANAGKKVERFSYKPWGMRRDPKRWDLNNANDYAVRFSRGYCMHEHIRELGLIDMGGRMYDEHTHQFLSPDPYMQDPESWLSHNRFSYCMHNPVMYTDPNGEYCLIDDLLAMGLGGVVNVVSNLVSGNIHSFGQGCAYFGIGAVSAEVSLYASPIVGGSLLGGANSALTSYIQTGSVNGQSMAMGAFMGGATSYLGSIVGGKASAWISKWTGKLASPILKSWLPQAFGGSASGFTLSTGMSLLNGESLATALKEGGKGAASGFAIGSLSGIAYGFKNAKSENVSPWTGKVKGPEYNKHILSENGIYSTQKGLNSDIVDEYYNQMENGCFKASDRPITGYKYNNEYYITDGHHRMAAAYRIYSETGNKDYINQLIKYGSFDNNNPANYGYYKTRLFK